MLLGLHCRWVDQARLGGWPLCGWLGSPMQAGSRTVPRAPGSGATSPEQVHIHEYTSGVLACHSWGSRSGRGWGECSRAFQAAEPAGEEAQKCGLECERGASRGREEAEPPPRCHGRALGLFQGQGSRMGTGFRSRVQWKDLLCEPRTPVPPSADPRRLRHPALSQRGGRGAGGPGGHSRSPGPHGHTTRSRGKEGF